jgi:hypothetical protein
MALKPFVPPDDEKFLACPLGWATHQAVFLLVGWPKEIREGIDEETNYFPKEGFDFDPKAYGASFQEVYFRLDEALESGEVRAERKHFCRGIDHIIAPNEVILWRLQTASFSLIVFKSSSASFKLK